MTCRFCLGTWAMVATRTGTENAGGVAGVVTDMGAAFCFGEWLRYYVRCCHTMIEKGFVCDFAQTMLALY